ncbi:ExbD/TolR family protein [Algihabitans albus]|uniref:ExbD/TolR family protein n=1 Tax=Algihabitans albus TaxID=2164067 RepID=UPI000E5C5B27|nr:biopolymer transporter ExbD [Algihabitans albus]
MRFQTSQHLQSHRAKSDDERILPLVNVVFLLLIFFMLAGQLAASDPFEIAPPQSSSEGSAGTQDLLVLIGVDGRLALDGEMLSEADFRTAVAERLSNGEAPSIRLKADGGAEATQVVAVMELLRAAGVERLTLLTLPQPGSSAGTPTDGESG